MRIRVGDAQRRARSGSRMPCCCEDRLDLRAAAVHEHEADAEAVQQVEVVDDAEERVVGHAPRRRTR